MLHGSFQDFFRKFSGCFKRVLRLIQGSFKVQGKLWGDLRVSKRSSKGVKMEFGGTFKDVSMYVCSVSMFQDNLKKVKVFQECFNEVLFDKIFVAWISSQLPEQKEGLFSL